MTRRWPAVVVAITFALAGCGGGGLPEPLAQDLQRRVAEVRQAVVAQDRPTAAEKLAEIRAIVEEARAQGQIDADRAADIQAAVEQVEVNLTLLPEPAPPPAPPPVTETDRDEDREDKDDDKNDGKDDDGKDNDGKNGDGKNGDGKNKGKGGGD